MANDLVKITDYTQYNSLFIQFFKDKTKFIQLQDALARQCEDIEDAIFEFIDEFNIDNGTGDTLDIIGKWLEIDRDGRSDVDYRKVLKVKAIINSGSGEHETVISALTGIYGATKVHLIYLGNANLQIWVDTPLTSTDYLEILEILAAGVGLILVEGSGNPFVFFDDPDGAGYSYLVGEELAIDSGDGSGEELLDIDPGTGTESLTIFHWGLGIDELSIDFGSGEELLLIDFGSGEESLLINFTDITIGGFSDEGGEYQSVIGQTEPT